MKKLILSLLAGLALLAGPVGSASAAGGGIAWDKFPKERVTDLAALQSGARLFVNYCLNCHAAAFMRFNRLRDIGLTEQQIKENLIFTGAKVGDPMTIALAPADGKEWFGGNPPDLTLIARSRADVAKGSGADYLYTFLRNFYRDESKVTGWNNAAFPSVGMPHVLWELQGQQRAVFVDQKDPHDASKVVHVLERYEPITPGKLSQADYNLAVADLVAFLHWMGEPNQGDRVRIGVWVLLFLGLFTLAAWRLSAAFWKDVK